MIVFGDSVRRESTRDLLADLAGRLRCLPEPGPAPGLGRHEALVASFILAGEIAQGLLDEAFEQAGRDEWSPLHARTTALLLALARALHKGTAPEAVLAASDELAALDLPAAIQVKQAEGFAHYALYPEAYLTAGCAFGRSATVIGIRSIGAALGALVAAASGSRRLVTLRPTGHPFDRRLALADGMMQAILADRDGPFAIVDEGPGLSGSSFGAVADWLEGQGIAATQIHFFPSHDCDPGPMALPRHAARWRKSARHVVDFGQALPVPLEDWFGDRVGDALRPVEDLSGGAWRAGRDIPARPWQEKRKFLLHATTGTYRLKFVGLGPAAAGKFGRAQALHRAGFTPEPVALRHGFLLERWETGAVPLGAGETPPLRRLADYLVFRARHFPAAATGADPGALLAMARHNAAEAIGPGGGASLLPGWDAARCAALGRRLRPVHVDARLHAWEWLRRPDGTIVKTDALDHSAAHDLIGPQDIAWDIAGAAVEFSLNDAALADLTAMVAAALPLEPAAIAFMIPCYLGFQAGYWHDAAREDAEDRATADRAAFYAAALRCLSPA